MHVGLKPGEHVTGFPVGHGQLVSLFDTRQFVVDSTRYQSETGRSPRSDYMTNGHRFAQVLTGQLADWTTRGCHRRLCVLSFRSFGGICETASCPLCHFPVRELTKPRLHDTTCCETG